MLATVVHPNSPFVSAWPPCSVNIRLAAAAGGCSTSSPPSQNSALYFMGALETCDPHFLRTVFHVIFRAQ